EPVCWIREFRNRPAEPTHHHDVLRWPLADDLDLRRPEIGRETRRNRRTRGRRIPRDQDLENRADACAGRIAIAALLQHPPAAADRENDIGDGGSAFLRDEKLHFAIARRTEARQQALPDNRKVHEVAVALEV